MKGIKIMTTMNNAMNTVRKPEYIKMRCKNAGQAAINAGYSPKSAQSQASQILKDSEVSEYLKQRKDELSRDLRNEFIFDALEARKTMYEIMTDPDAENRDKIAVAKDFLDRAGFKPTDEVKLSGDVNNPFAGLTTDELKKLIEDE
jgi:phage terminase small subunit